MQSCTTCPSTPHRKHSTGRLPLPNLPPVGLRAERTGLLDSSSSSSGAATLVLFPDLALTAAARSSENKEMKKNLDENAEVKEEIRTIVRHCLLHDLPDGGPAEGGDGLLAPVDLRADHRRPAQRVGGAHDLLEEER